MGADGLLDPDVGLDQPCLRFGLSDFDLDLGAVPGPDGPPETALGHTLCRKLPFEHRFCHDQIEKLDSMTSAYYVRSSEAETQSGVFSGERKIVLPLKAIENHIRRTYMVDQRLSMAIAPVVIEDHLVLIPKALYDPIKLALVTLIVGWLVGCLLAWIVENRKKIIAWLKR